VISVVTGRYSTSSAQSVTRHPPVEEPRPVAVRALCQFSAGKGIGCSARVRGSRSCQSPSWPRPLTLIDQLLLLARGAELGACGIRYATESPDPGSTKSNAVPEDPGARRKVSCPRIQLT
jgi:hypothetical protein